MAKRGRPPIEIDWEEFEALCAIQATLREMAIVFGCSEDTIQRAVKKHYKENFSVVFGEKRLRRFVSLRRRIWQSALNGNVTLLIFLAKQYLGMADQVVVKLPGQPPHRDKPDLSRLTDEQLDQLEWLVESAYPGKLPAVDTPAATATQEQESQSAGAPAEPAPDPGGEVAPTPPPVRPTDQT